MNTLYMLLGILSADASATESVESPPGICEVPYEDGADHFQKPPTLIGPLQVKAANNAGSLPYQRSLPDGRQLDGVHQLFSEAAPPLFMVGFPLQRFVATLTTEPIQTRQVGDQEVVVVPQGTPQGEALACARVVIIPILKEYSIEEGEAEREVTDKDGKKRTVREYSYTSAARISLKIYQREGDELVLTKTLSASSSQGGGAVSEDAGLRLVGLSEGQLGLVRAEMETARPYIANDHPLTILPVAESLTEHPALEGVRWRGVATNGFGGSKDRTIRYNPEVIEQSVLGALQESIESLRFEVREAFVLKDKVDLTVKPKRMFYARRFPEASLPSIDASFDTNLGDIYWLCPPGLDGGRGCGWAKVSAPPATSVPLELEVVAGSRTMLKKNARSLTGIEEPQKGVGLSFSLAQITANRPEALLPSDPFDGSERSIEEGSAAWRLSAETMIENPAHIHRYAYLRGSLGGAGSLSTYQGAAGLERRYLLASRTFIHVNLGGFWGSWSVPSGEGFQEWDEESEEYEDVEPSADASQWGAEAAAGLVYWLSPNLSLKGSIGGQVATQIREFSWSYTDEEENSYSGVVTPEVADGGAFQLKTTGLVAGVTTSFVF